MQEDGVDTIPTGASFQTQGPLTVDVWMWHLGTCGLGLGNGWSQ